ncbi:MAG TPA: TIGR03435 family protein [Candidatus Sulfotelmatobacter sp.]|nr:TIGR03435 family protein [Candidatus Sulfotelmatobacter sp.]
MQELDDNSLLKRFAEQNSEEAFAAIVARHINKVYSAALRHTGNPGYAEEITQAVFVTLAKKARVLSRSVILSGWLYQTARLTSLTFLRSEIRRERREQEAHMQSTMNQSADETWTQISPFLDSAMASLNETDRSAVVLRFFDRKSLRDVGAILGATEDSARMRVNRALEKLRGFFAARGVHSTTTLIAGAIASNSVQVAPAALAQSVTSAAVAKAAAAGASTLTLVRGALKVMAWTKTHTTAVGAIAILLLAAGAATTVTVTTDRIHERHVRSLEPIWHKNKDIASEVIDALPPLFEVVPTKFKPPWNNWNSGRDGDKCAGARHRADVLAGFAYDVPPQRIRFPDGLPSQLYDFVVTEPHGREEMQRWLKENLGLVGRYETDDVDVLLLRVANTNAPGYKPAIPGRNDQYWKDDPRYNRGIYHSSNEIMYSAPRLLGFALFVEWAFGEPVIDQTGITRPFAVPHFTWPETAGNTDLRTLRQALADQLGLELAPGHMPIQYLVMEKVK